MLKTEKPVNLKVGDLPHFFLAHWLLKIGRVCVCGCACILKNS